MSAYRFVNLKCNIVDKKHINVWCYQYVKHKNFEFKQKKQKIHIFVLDNMSFFRYNIDN